MIVYYLLNILFLYISIIEGWPFYLVILNIMIFVPNPLRNKSSFGELELSAKALRLFLRVWVILLQQTLFIRFSATRWLILSWLSPSQRILSCLMNIEGIIFFLDFHLRQSRLSMLSTLEFSPTALSQFCIESILVFKHVKLQLSL